VATLLVLIGVTYTARCAPLGPPEGITHARGSLTRRLNVGRAGEG
jgi:hypothetical protein